MGEPRDTGASLVEVIVAIGLFGVVGSLLLGLGISTGRVTEETTRTTGLNGEARLVLERLTRELRQADSIAAPLDLNPVSTTLSFHTDFDGNPATEDATDPETLTYRFVPGVSGQPGELRLSAGTEQDQLLAEDVQSFTVELFSSHWEFDANGDDVTAWDELPTGDELEYIDLVQVTIVVGDDTGRPSQTYRTQATLRNRE